MPAVPVDLLLEILDLSREAVKEKLTTAKGDEIATLQGEAKSYQALKTLLTRKPL